jgi:hypothetical protein
MQAQYSYTINAGAITITGYSGPGGTLIIPANINNLPVTSIGDSAFYERESLTSVTIPNSVTSIGEEAFEGCFKLTNVTIPASVTSIGDHAFESCSSVGTWVVTWTGVSSIGDFAFTGCVGLTNVTFSDGLTNIGDYAFWITGLTSVTIPSSVTSIGDGTFNYCTNLTSVTIPASVTSIGVAAFQGCGGLTSVTIPNSVASIGQQAFEGCASLTSVTIPNSVTSIGLGAFDECSSLAAIKVDAQNALYSGVNGVLFNKSQTMLVEYPGGISGSYTIPASVTSIGEEAFYACANLTRVTIPNSVTSIGDGAFYECSSLATIDVDAQNAFYSSVRGVLFNKSQTMLVEYPGGISGSYTIPASVTSIGHGAFLSCTRVTSVTIPATVTNIGISAFWGCASLTSVTIPNGVISIGALVFVSCTSLTSVTIPSSVTNIGDSAFEYCTSLTSVTIPNSVTSIGVYSFGDCSRLTSVYFEGNAPTTDPSAFNSDNNVTLYYLPGTTGWSSPFAGVPAVVWNPLISVTPDTTTFFGSIQTGSLAERSFTIFNGGQLPLQGSASIASPFTIVAGANYELTLGQSQTVTIRYAPTTPESDSGYVTFTLGASSITRQVTGSAYGDPTLLTGSIAGRVTRSDTGDGLNGAAIMVIGSGGSILNGGSSPSTLSGIIGGQSGGYVISGLAPNVNYEVIVTPPPAQLQQLYMGESDGVTVVAGQTTTANIQMMPVPVNNQPPAPSPDNSPVVFVRGFGPDTAWNAGESDYWSTIEGAVVGDGILNVWDCNDPEPNVFGGGGHVINGELGIEENAANLAAYIRQKALKFKTDTGFYPTQINIVAHSMGGLFARRLLGNSDRLTFTDMTSQQPFTILVNKVVMLATPQCGSPVADLAIALHPFDNFLGGSWESTQDLTRFYMILDFNQAFRNWPSTVPLYLFSASGGYKAVTDGLPSWLGAALTAGSDYITTVNSTLGPDEIINDGVVTGASASGVFWGLGATWPPLQSYTSVILTPVQSITDVGIGGPLDHLSLLNDSKVAQWVADTVASPSARPTSLERFHTSIVKSSPIKMNLTNSAASLPMQVCEQTNSILWPGTTSQISVISDAHTTLLFHLVANDTNIIFRLSDPSGVGIDATTPKSNTNVTYSMVVTASNLTVASYQIAGPTNGTWTAIIDGASVSASNAAYVLSVFGDASVALVPQTGAVFNQGQDVVIICTLADVSTNPAIPIHNASISATVQLPDGSTNRFILFDDGAHNDGAPNDGVYAAVLSNVQEAGHYSVSYRCQATNNQGQALQRVASGAFSVSSGDASLVGDPTYETVDTNGDGVADFLDVKCWVNATIAGSYVLSCDLVDSTETNRFSKSAEVTLNGTGTTMVSLIFNLANIPQLTGSTNYHIENLQLFEITASGSSWVDAYHGSSSVTISSVPSAPTITSSTNLPSAATGVPYSTTLEAMGGTTPYAWSTLAGSLPSGLTLASNGTISGTPTMSTNANFIVQVVGNNGLSATNAFILSSDPSPPPAASFTASQTNGLMPLTVNFTNTSTGIITNEVWNFGDGGVSDMANPTHTYTNSGLFSVSLTVLGPGGSNSIIQSNLVTIPDIQGPTLVIISPSNNATISSPHVSISGTATDNGTGNNGVSSVTVNGVTATGDNASGTYAANWSVTITLLPGTNSISVVAKDGLNNSTQITLTLTYLPDTRPPAITVQPTNETVLTGNTVTFSLTASGAGPLTYQWLFNGTNLPGNIITTVAGGGIGDTGAANHASLNYPFGLATDAHGSLFVADTHNNRIRKVNAEGIVTTVAGNRNQNYSGDGGVATGAGFNNPFGVGIDARNNLFIADTDNNRIRIVGTNGIVTTVAGNGISGYAGDGGIATSAHLNSPVGVALDTHGNLFIADTDNNRIRMINANGIIATVAGNGTSGYSGDGGMATNASLNNPVSITVDPFDNLYIADSGNNCIRRVNVSGVIGTVAGNRTSGYSGDGESATNATLNNPSGVVVDANANLFIADTYNQRVRMVNTNGTIITIAGDGIQGYSGDDGAATNASLYYPSGIAIDLQGNLMIADLDNNRIRKVDPNGVITTLAGGGDGGAATNAALVDITGVALDTKGNLVFADYDGSRIRKVDTDGIISTVVGNGMFGDSGDGGPATNATLTYPYDVAVDGFGNLFIDDAFITVIRKVDSNGIITTVAGNGSTHGYIWDHSDGEAATNASLASPTGVTTDTLGNLIIADAAFGRVRKVDASGIITTVAGNGTSGYSGDGGPATNAGVNCVRVAADIYGNLFIADSANNRIRKVEPNGIITTAAGNGNQNYSGDGGTGTNAGLNNPFGVAVDSYGNFFIADSGNNRIRKVNVNGTITTVAGNGISGYSGDGGMATNARISLSTSLATGVAVDADENLFFADNGNHRVRKVSAPGPQLVLNNVTVSNAGNYAVIISNPYGSVTSSVVTLIVATPPSITNQPTGQSVTEGQSARFSVAASGTIPLTYQWQFDGTNVSGATNSAYTINSIATNNTGFYSVVVSNAYGAGNEQRSLFSGAFANGLAASDHQPHGGRYGRGPMAGGWRGISKQRRHRFKPFGWQSHGEFQYGQWLDNAR